MSYLNKKEYLRELSDELRGYFKRKDVKNIIADYNEFFDAGISEGRSEDEICEEFGDVQNLAREIAENQTDVKRKTYNKKYIIVGSFAVVIFFMFFIMNEVLMITSYHFYFDSFLYQLSKTGIIIVPPLILMLIKFYKKYEININEKILFIFACIPVAIILFLHIQFILFNQAPPGHPVRIMWEASILLFSIKVLSIFSIAVITILNLRKENPDYINIASSSFILTGVYQTFNTILCLIGDMDEIIPFLLKLFNSFIPLCVGLVIAALLYLFSFWRRYLPKSKNQEGAGK